MKIVVLGAGGVGGIVGGVLALAGEDVTFIARGAHLAAMREKGLTLRTAHRGDIVIKNIGASTAAGYDGGAPDVIFVCFKYYSLPDATAFVRKNADEHTLTIPLLNVFGTGEVMQAKLDGLTVLDGCVYIYGMVDSPGVVAQPAEILRVFYGFRPGEERRLFDVAKKLEPVLKNAGIDAHFTENIRREALKKFSYVSPLGAAGLYYGAVSGDFMRPGKERELFRGLIREIEALGRGMGIDFDESLEARNLALMDSFTKDLKTSMQRDVERGGPSEFDGLVHRVVRLGRDYKVPVPLYEKISAWGRARGIR